MNKSVDKGEVGIVVIFFLVRDLRRFYNFHLADVYLAGQVVARLVLEEHWVCDSSNEVRF